MLVPNLSASVNKPDGRIRVEAEIRKKDSRRMKKLGKFLRTHKLVTQQGGGLSWERTQPKVAGSVVQISQPPPQQSTHDSASPLTTTTTTTSSDIPFEAVVEASYVQQDSPILLLPDEISVYIMSFADVSGLFSLTLTCRQYYWLAKEPLAEAKRRMEITLSSLQLLKVIGRGSFCIVYQARHKPTGKIVCVKCYDRKETLNAHQEHHLIGMVDGFRIMAGPSHPFTMINYCTFQTVDKLYVVGELFNGGELYSHLQKKTKFDEDTVRIWGAELVSAVDYLHKKNILLRAIKPEDLAIDSKGHLHFIDYNLIKILDSPDGKTTTFCGTPEYLSPELLTGNSYGVSVDWWAIATLMYELAVGIPPFYDQNVQTMYSKIMNATITWPAHLSEAFRDLLSKMLQRDTSIRLIKGDEIKAHPFFENIDWEKLHKMEIPCPYVPSVKDELDTSGFDTTFTNEEIRYDTSGPLITIPDPDPFAGFDWVNPDCSGLWK